MFLSPGSRSHLRSPALLDRGIIFKKPPAIRDTWTAGGTPAMFCLTTSGGSVAGCIDAQLTNLPEIVAQFNIVNGVRTTNAGNTYKVALASLAFGNSGASNTYGLNTIVQASSGFTSLATCAEFDTNNVSGTDLSTASLGTGQACYGLTMASGSGNWMSAAIWIIGVGTKNFSNGIAISGSNTITSTDSTAAAFLDISNSYQVIRVTGSHTNGINMFAAGITGGTGAAVICPNASGLGSANAAGNATIPLLYLDGSNVSQYGSTSVIKHQFNVNPGGGTPAIAVINSHATANDIMLQLQGGAATAVDTQTLYCNFVNPGNTIQRGAITSNDSAGTGHVAFNTSSDERLKKSLGFLENALNRMMSIEVHRYQGSDYEGEDYEVGFFAQNLHRAYRWAVTPSTDPDFRKRPWQVDYGRVTPLLTAATQEIVHRLIALEARFSSLEARLSPCH